MARQHAGESAVTQGFVKSCVYRIVPEPSREEVLAISGLLLDVYEEAGQTSRPVSSLPSSGSFRDCIGSAVKFEEHGEWEKAKASYLKAIEAKPEIPHTRLEAAKICLRLGRAPQARELLEAELKLGENEKALKLLDSLTR